uniref:BTB domain-containing protein n=1 Tax=Panagrolaimus davidi TaxID=227884 RepID=A0A914Q579_9BILA
MQSQNTVAIQKYAFKTTWEMDEKLFDDTKVEFATESKAVEGMPDVKWHLECDNTFPPDIYFVVESETQIEYSMKYKISDNTSQILEKSDITSTGNLYVHLLRVYGSLYLLSIPTNEIRNYVENGKITLDVEAIFSYKNKPINDFYVDGASEWGLRLKQNNSEDFEILVDGETIRIHKFMLIAESPVFTKMFESDFNEAKEKKVTITDFKYEIVQAAIDYCYRQNITEFLKDYKNMMELLRFSDKYDFQTLKPKLEKHVENNLTKENVFHIASTAEKANAPKLRQACIKFVKQFLNNCTAWPATEMTVIDPIFLKDLVASALNMNNSA